MILDQTTNDLYSEICRIPLIDPHTHINPLQPASKGLEDILGYHYYTELAHSAGMDQSCLRPELSPVDRIRHILSWLACCDNSVQYSWFLEIVRSFLGFTGDAVGPGDTEALMAAAETAVASPTWAEEVLRKSNIEKVFLTNDFDDPLEGFDTARYVPCLRTDDLVFHFHKPEVRRRLAKATGIEVGSAADMRRAVGQLFEKFKLKGAKACAISLPPDFSPTATNEEDLCRSLSPQASDVDGAVRSSGIFWMLAEHCREHALPFDLMIGVNRNVYEKGVFQGRDLFDQRTSLIQYRQLFNAFPTVNFCISVLTSVQNQELVSYSWIFPNVLTSGHWWYSNIPTYIQHDLSARLQAVPRTKQIGYYSDMYKLEFGLPKFNMYRRVLADLLSREFIRPGRMTETKALEVARCILRDNVERVFAVS